jgi:3-phosphoshikimate 1-carboxyvinyltransferase
MTTPSSLSVSTDLRSVRIEPSGPLGGYITVPPSKNATTRFILAAALARGRSEVLNPARNDDAIALIRCCTALGARIGESPEGLTIEGVDGQPRNPGVMNPDNAGAVLRLLLAVGCLVHGPIRFETQFGESLGRRPNRELLDALAALGASVREAGPDGQLPIVLEAGRDALTATSVEVDGRRSSQFVTALLFLGSCLDHPLLISVMNQTVGPRLVSRPLIDQTLDALRRFGAAIREDDAAFTWQTAGGGLRGGRHTVPGDWPSAAALMASVAVAGGMVTLKGLQNDAQGERRAREAFEAMGCEVSAPEAGILTIHSKGVLHAIEFDGDLATDAVLAIEAAACLAEGTSRITGIGNLRIKESDRIRLPLAELAKLGITSRSGEDWVEIDGRPEGFEGGVEVNCHGDHRIAQLLAIVGTRCERGLKLRGADCVSKSYPGFFDDLGRMGVHWRPE